MATEYFEKTPAKANRWFKAFVIFALLYGITFSLASFFNWIFFCATAYSLFMSYFLLPQQPKIFQARPKQGRQFTGGSRPGAQGYSSGDSSSVDMNPAEKQKKAASAVIAGIVAIVFVFVLIGIFSGGDDETTTTESSQTDETPASFVDKGNSFYGDQNYDSAEWYYDRALQDNPNNLDAVYGKGIALYAKQRFDDAYTYLLKAHEEGFEGAWLSLVLADMYDKRGQSARAVEFYKESVALDSACFDCYTRLAELEPANSTQYLQLAEKYK